MQLVTSVYIGVKEVDRFDFFEVDKVENKIEALSNLKRKRPFYFETEFGYCCGFFLREDGNSSKRRYTTTEKGCWIVKTLKKSRNWVHVDYFHQWGFLENTLNFSFAITKND